MADVNKLLQDIGKLSPADKENISQACGGSHVKEENDGASEFSCDRNSQARISTFSGDGNKGKVSFAQWRFEVRGLVRDKIYSEPVMYRLYADLFVAPPPTFFCTWASRSKLTR